MRLILEGLTGTGKSQTIAALERLGRLPELFIAEEETFGDLMEEIARGEHDEKYLLRRLGSVFARLERSNTPFLVERFHLSYYALLPTWSAYAEFDAALAERGVSIVLLHVPESELRTRCLLRREYGGSDWQDFSVRFGTEEGALTALRQSQERRFEALERSRIPHRIIDTSGMDWDAYARTISDAGVRP